MPRTKPKKVNTGITIDADVLADVKRMAGQVPVSAWIQTACEMRLQGTRGLTGNGTETQPYPSGLRASPAK